MNKKWDNCFYKSLEDKEKWGDGPWQSEPEYKEFTYKAILCVLNRGPVGAWNGYIAIPKDHSILKKDTPIDELLEVHGGVTYSEDHPPYFHENYDKNYNLGLFWIGFDCAHAGDLSPVMQFHEKITLQDEAYLVRPHLKEAKKLSDDLFINIFGSLRQEYRTIEYASNELKQMIDQIEEKK